MNFLVTIGWGRLTVLAVVLLGANAVWIAWEAKVPTGNATILVWQWASVLLSLLIVSLIAGCIACRRFVGILIDERFRMSLARFQWLLWFLVLFSGYFTGAVWDVAYGGDLPALEPDLFGVIGITTGSAVISNILVDTKKRERAPPLPAGSPPARGLVDVNTNPAQAAWEDLYLGEEVANRMTVDASRLQKVIITILLVIVYMQMLWSAFVEASLTYHAF